MSYPPIDRVGLDLGQLFVFAILPREKHRRHRRWLCLCRCGELHVVSAKELVPSRRYEMRSRTCGCGAARNRRAAAMLSRPVERREVFGDRTNEEIDALLGLNLGSTSRRLGRGWPPQACLEIPRGGILREWREARRG